MASEREEREELDDSTLLERFVAGDHPAFDALVRRHEDRVFGLTLRMTGDRADALDATQDAFLSVFRKAATFRSDAAFSTWLYRIAVNSANDLLRKRKRFPIVDDDSEPEAASTIDVAGQATARLDVQHALQLLPPEYRDAVVMHDLGSIPYDEIAAIMNVQIGTVKSRISRGRRRLADLLEHPAGPEPSKEAT